MMYMSDINIPPTPLNAPAAPVEEQPSRPAPTVALSSPEAQEWLFKWTQAAFAKEPLPALPEAYGIPASAAGVALTEAFNAKVQTLVDQYPEEHRKNQLIPVLVLARALGAWQDTFSPTGADWLNLRTNLGYYQQKHEKEWRAQFEGPRPSALTWLTRVPEALNYELNEKQITRMSKSLKASENATPRFWSMVSDFWAKFAVDNPPQSIQDNLNLCAASISVGMQIHQTMRDIPDCVNVDTLPPFVHAMDAFELAVPARDYQKGWDYQVRTSGRAFALAQAKSHYPDGIPDDPNDRVAHLKLVDKYYELFERSFEPWRWDGLGEASPNEQAQTWAWLTSWAPEYNWDQTVKAIGIHPPVEAVGREYTGQSTQWWLTASHDDKTKAAQTWIEGASFEMDAARREHCNIDNFIGGMFGH